MGHLPMKMFLMNDYAREEYDQGRLVCMSVVREPIERLVSGYNYLRYHQEDELRERVENLSLDHFMELAAVNQQAEFLKFGEEIDLAESFSKVELYPLSHAVEGIGASCRKHFGKGFRKLPIVNTSKGNAGGRQLSHVSDIGPSLMSELREKHALDIELYDRVCRQWDQEASAS